MAIAPTFPLAAPPTSAAARRYSILDAAVGPLDLPDGGRLADVAYTVPWCGGGTVIDPECVGIENDFEAGLDVVEGGAFVVQRAFTCLAPGKTPADVERFARDRLEGSEHVLVEAKVAAMLAAADGLVDVGTGATIAEAVSLLESYAYTVGGTVGADEDTAGVGLAAVIHMPVAAWAYLAEAGQITKAGAVWVTPLGSVVAPNAGITTATAYITGPVVLWRAPAPFLPPVEAAFNPVTNEYRMFASRDYAAAWECFTASVALGVLA